TNRVQPVTRERLAANAYRVLGLGASAGQSDIDAAARRMRIWPDPRRIPPTAWDIPSLGPIARTRGDIEQAVTRLSNPRTRLQERLLWYHSARPLTLNLNERTDGDGARRPPAASPERNDQAVAALHAANL